jgi:TonB family protein
MTALSGPTGGAFKRALYISGAFHALLLLLIIINPSLPSSRKTGVLTYINLGSWGGGGGGGNGGVRGPGGGGGGTETIAETPLPQKTLRDLTTIQKLQAENQSSLRYPVEKSKRDRSKPVPDKQAVVAKPDPKATSDKTSGRAASGSGGQSGGGAGLRIGGYGPGAGDGPGGGGGGGQLGIDNFPYAYYLQNIQDRISARWFQSLVDPGVNGTFQTTVYFRIFRDGSISEVEIKESSGLPSLDLSAKRAIVTAAPFPPLPADYDEQYLGIRLIFEHSK